MKENDEKPHPWAPVEGIDEEYPVEGGYELVTMDGAPPPDGHTVGAEFMFDMYVPPAWRRKYLKCPTVIKIWTKKSGWKLVAKFVSPQAAEDYINIISDQLLKLKNAEARRKR